MRFGFTRRHRARRSVTVVRLLARASCRPRSRSKEQARQSSSSTASAPRLIGGIISLQNSPPTIVYPSGIREIIRAGAWHKVTMIEGADHLPMVESAAKILGLIRDFLRLPR